MKKIILHFIVLFALIGALTSCSEKKIISADVIIEPVGQKWFVLKSVEPDRTMNNHWPVIYLTKKKGFPNDYSHIWHEQAENGLIKFLDYTKNPVCLAEGPYFVTDTLASVDSEIYARTFDNNGPTSRWELLSSAYITKKATDFDLFKTISCSGKHFWTEKVTTDMTTRISYQADTKKLISYKKIVENPPTFVVIPLILLTLMLFFSLGSITGWTNFDEDNSAAYNLGINLAFASFCLAFWSSFAIDIFNGCAGWEKILWTSLISAVYAFFAWLCYWLIGLMLQYVTQLKRIPMPRNEGGKAGYIVAYAIVASHSFLFMMGSLDYSWVPMILLLLPNIVVWNIMAIKAYKNKKKEKTATT